MILAACYIRFYNIMLDNCKITGEEILNLASDEIVIDHIPDYLSGAYDKEEYEKTARKLNTYIEYFKDIRFLYAYRINSGSTTATVIFDADSPGEENGDEPGADYELESGIIEHITALYNGEAIEPMLGDTEWGYLMTCSKPLIDSNGVCQGYLFADFNLTNVRSANIRFTATLFVLIFIIMLLILYFAMKAVSVRITGPIEKIFLCLKSFSFETDADRRNNLKELEALDIHTNQEIQSLYDTLVKTIQASNKYLHDLKVTSKKLENVEGKVYADALTGLGNKHAYEKRLTEYQKRIDKGTCADFAVIVMDINDLKYINDTFGHEAGDKYIKGCCKVVADVFGPENIYRIGGDEFVIFIDNEKYASRYIDLNRVREIFASCTGNRSVKEYKRFSAALGIANYASGSSENLLEVVKEADSRMYENKQRYKSEHGSYR